MESLKETKILKFHPDTLETVRKLYDLDKPGAMSDAIDILEEWIKRQDHFVKKDFSRDFLERLIIMAKGSIERSKQRLDKICTSKTLMPTFFINSKVTDLTDLDIINDVFLPKLTKDYYRVYFLRNVGQEIGIDFFPNYYRRLICLAEYVCHKDYMAGCIVVMDFRQLNLISLLKRLSPVELQQIVSIALECYGFRVKGIHLLSTSKLIETFAALLRQFVSAKIGSRIHVHSTLETLYDHIDKELLPEDYGGNEKPLEELHKLVLEELCSDENLAYMKMMNAAGTNEAYRQTAKYNEQVLGMPGSFRTLRVD